MGVDSDDARRVRRGSEAAQKDLPGLSEEDAGGNAGDRDPAADLPRWWERLEVWGVAIAVLIPGYIFAFPAVIVLLDDLDNLPDFFVDAVDIVLSPLVWLYLNASWYEQYIDWLESLFT